MAKLTRTAATVKAFEALGFKETNRSSKYRTFEDQNDLVTYLVGRSGALRRVKRGEPLTLSRSLTGTRLHTAIEYVGRTVARQPNLPASTLRELITKVMNREIYPAKEFEEMK